jgi:hypothetical protein
MSALDESGRSSTAPGQAPVWQPTIPEADPAALEPDVATGALGEASFADGTSVAGHTAGVRTAAVRSGKVRRAGSTSILLVVSALIALGGVGFAVGRATSTGTGGTAAVNDAGLNNGFPGGADASGRPDFAGAPGGLAGNDATVSGTVVSSTANSITIQLANGQQVTLATGSSTTYHSQAAASGSDVAVGASVIVKTSGTTATSAGATAGATAGAATGAGGTRTATDITITGN